jgi:hypothetical protein
MPILMFPSQVTRLAVANGCILPVGSHINVWVRLLSHDLVTITVSGTTDMGPMDVTMKNKVKKS